MSVVPLEYLPAEKLQQITNAIHTATGIACSVLTIEGEVVTQSGHQRICSRFHRKHPAARRSCLRHNQGTLARLAESREYQLLRCPHGLVDIATPIVVNEMHVANVFLGQFLLNTSEKKTQNRFEKQAERYGFEREAYIEALKAVPVYPEAKIKPLVICLSHTAKLIVEMSMDHRRHKQLTASLQESEKRFRLIADFTYDWEYWIDPAGRFIYVSPSCERITGHTSREFTDRPELFLDLIHQEDQTSVVYHLKNEMDAPGHSQFDFRIVDRTGKIKWLSHFCQPVYDDNGRWLGRRASNRDITDRKQMEADLIEHDAELQVKSTRLERANQALKSMLDHREAEKDAIEANIYRHLKKTILPYLEKARQSRPGPAAKTYLDRAASNLNAIIDGSRTSLFNHYLPLSPTEIKVAELVRQGQRTKQIAEALHLATSSVASYRKSIRRKLGLSNTKVNLRAYLVELEQ